MNWVTEKSLLPPEEAFRSYPDFNEAVHAYEVDSDLYAGARPVTSNDLLQGQIIDSTGCLLRFLVRLDVYHPDEAMPNVVEKGARSTHIGWQVVHKDNCGGNDQSGNLVDVEDYVLMHENFQHVHGTASTRLAAERAQFDFEHAALLRVAEAMTGDTGWSSDVYDLFRIRFIDPWVIVELACHEIRSQEESDSNYLGQRRCTGVVGTWSAMSIYRSSLWGKGT